MDKFTSPKMVQNMCANDKKFKGKIGKLARRVLMPLRMLMAAGIRVGYCRALKRC